MPLDPPKQPPKDQRDWDQWTRSVRITPSNQTVGTDQIIDDAVTPPKMSNAPALSVLGNPGGTLADPAYIGAGTNGHFFRRKADGLAFGPIEDADIPAEIARDAEVAAAITAHEGSSDPHPTYTTAAELSAAITAHEGAGDPHPIYLTSAEGNAAYQPISTALSLIYTGTGTPEGAVTAGVGSIFLRQDGGAGTTLYVKESGSGNTGWVAK